MARRGLMDETEIDDIDVVDFLLGEYATEVDSKLTRGAMRFKRSLLRILKKHGFVPEREGIREGVRHAASFIESFDGKVDHPWRLSDVVLFKFGLIGKRKVRKVRGIMPGPGLQFRTLPQKTIRKGAK